MIKREEWPFRGGVSTERTFKPAHYVESIFL